MDSVSASKSNTVGLGITTALGPLTSSGYSTIYSSSPWYSTRFLKMQTLLTSGSSVHLYDERGNDTSSIGTFS